MELGAIRGFGEPVSWALLVRLAKLKTCSHTYIHTIGHRCNFLQLYPSSRRRRRRRGCSRFRCSLISPTAVIGTGAKPLRASSAPICRLALRTSILCWRRRHRSVVSLVWPDCGRLVFGRRPQVYPAISAEPKVERELD